MPVRVAVAFTLLITALVGPVTARAQNAQIPPFEQAAQIVLSASPTGELAPGTALTVTVSGLLDNSFVIAAQCPTAGEVQTCGPRLFIGAEDGGPSERTFVVRRTIVGTDGTLTDCSAAPCELRVLDNDAAPLPIEIDSTTPLVSPTLTLSPPSGLADNELVVVSGSGFSPYGDYVVAPCAAFVCDSPIGRVFTDQNGNIDAQAIVARRTVAGVDCAEPASACALWVSGASHLDELTIVALDFDAAREPFPSPSAVVAPAADLLDGQTIDITVSEVPPDGAYVRQCAIESQRCVWESSPFIPPGDADEATVQLDVRRRISDLDCASDGCEIVVDVWPYDPVRVPIAFDTSVPPPPLPTLEIAPTSELIDLQPITMRINDATSGAFVAAAVCTAVDTAVRRCANVFDGPAPGPDGVTVRVPRIIDRTIDCATVGCELTVAVYEPGGDIQLSQPLSFDPDGPLAPLPDFVALPDRGLWDGQRIEVRASNLRRAGYYQLQQCLGVGETLDRSACSPAAYVRAQVDDTGRASLHFSVERTFTGFGGTEVDCLISTCSVVVTDDNGFDAGIVAGLPISFSATGDVGGFPAQLECVAWPAESWPVGELPDGITIADLDAIVEPSRNNGEPSQSMVVIHGGELVYEFYDDDIDAESILPSFSVAKSVTSTLVGMLIDDGVLELDGPAPVPEWSDADDPRHDISLRNLLHMSSGLEWNESYDFADPTNDIIQMLVSGDIGAYVANKPLVHEPGEQWVYSTGTSSLIARIMAQETGLYGDDFEALMYDRLFTPIGIETTSLGFDDTGVWYGGSQANMATRDFARLGMLYLRGGVWDDEQLLPDGWAEFVRTPAPSTQGYGAQFWLDGRDDRFRMVGIFGQQVLIVPGLDLVVAVNNGGGSAAAVAELFESVARPSCTTSTIATDDDATVAPSGTVRVDVIANDQGAGEQIAVDTLTVATSPTSGTVTVDDNMLVYTNTSGAVGDDTFSYVVCNESRSCGEATVSVSIAEPPIDPRDPLAPVTSGGTATSGATRCSISATC